MTNSRLIAGLAGPVLAALAASEALTYHIWAGVTAPLVYLNGTILFASGVAIIRFHNIWVRGWQVLVTLLGWLLSLAGLYRMFMPEAPQLDESGATYAMLAGLFALSALLTYKGYAPEGKGTRGSVMS